MRKDDPPIRPEVKADMRAIADVLRNALPISHGFALLVFDYGDGGHMSYISSGQRVVVVKAMREFIARNDVES